MKLACNYYAETEALAREGRIDIDYFKFPALGFQMDVLNDLGTFAAFAEKVSEVKPILLHHLHPGTHDLSSPKFARGFDFAAVNELLRVSGTPGISLHPSMGKPAVREGRLVQTIAGNLRFLREQFPGLAFVSVENPPDPKFGALVRPEVLSEIIHEAGCFFLLDISHAWCAARLLGMELWEYLSRLPLEKVYEIHINGWAEKDGDKMCHVKINEEGYEILGELLGRCQPEIITIEYGRPNDRIGCGCPVMRPGEMNRRAMKEIAEQAGRVREMMRKFG